MKCSDLSDRRVLEFLRDTNDTRVEAGIGLGWVFLWEIADAFPEFPPKLVQAKMRKLIKRGFVSGCACGCRGDFEITDRGRNILTGPILFDSLWSASQQ